MYTVFYLVFSFSCLFEKCIFIFGTHRNKSWYIPNNKQTKFNQQSLKKLELWRRCSTSPLVLHNMQNFPCLSSKLIEAKGNAITWSVYCEITIITKSTQEP